MAMKSRSRPTTAGTGVGEEGSTRKKIQDVLGQARAALRQSQQFRWTTSDKKNNNLSSRLAFQQQQQDDYWSSENAGEVIKAETVNPLYEGARPHSKSVGKAKTFFNQDNDFGLPFRDTQNKSMSPKLLGSTREQQKKEMGKRKDKDKDDASSDTTSVSMSTADLKVTSDSDDSSGGSQASVRKAPSKISKISKEVKIIEAPREALVNEPQPSVSAVTNAAITMVPSMVTKLTPLKGRYPEDEKEEVDDADSVMDDPGLPAKLTTTVAVLSDELGFSRASIKKATEDPHWFEKALLVRGEPISEAAYKAFKKAHEEQEGAKKKTEALKVKHPKRFPQPPPPPSLGAASSTITAKEPEFTADWISDIDVSSYQSEVDMPTSVHEDLSTPGLISVVEEHISTIPDLEEDYDDKTIIDEANTESIIRTATELEASGVLSEIASNLQNVLDMSEKPATEDFSRMSAEERSFAREYDEVMLDKDEPLGAIFHSVYSGGEEEAMERSRKSKEEQISKSLGLSNRDAGEYDEEEEETQYESTFISASTNISERSMPTKKSSPTYTNTITKTSMSRKTLSKSKSSVGGTLTTPSPVGAKDKKSTKDKEFTLMKVRSRDDTASSVTSSQATPQPKITSLPTSSSTKKSRPVDNTTTSKSKTKTSKSKTKTETRTSRQISISRTKSPPPQKREPTTTAVPTPAPLDPPSNRYQKNIHSILEKEVYQKELRRQRHDRVRSERKQERQQTIAKESIERNKRTTWKDPTTTEILLPELFKYKSISGLQAAKAKKSEHFRSHPSMNYGAPYFQMSGAISGSEDHEGTAQMLASAQMETLDIPDLVREVLASNDRMYRMTIEAGRGMNKVYKEKMKGKR